MRYLLDTHICIYIAKRKPASVASRFAQLRPGEVGMSVITYLELVFGAQKSQHAEDNLRRIELLEQLIPAQPLDSTVGAHYGKLRTELERRGFPIGAYDMLIAAQALSTGLILVSNNAREFSRIEGLRLENWTE